MSVHGRQDTKVVAIHHGDTSCVDSAPNGRRRRHKLLFFIWALEVGGAERFLVELVQGLPKTHFEVKVVCIARKGIWAHSLERDGIEVSCLNKRTGFHPTILPRLMSLIRREKPDLVNTYLWTADLWARLAAILTHVPCILVTEQNVDVWKRWYHRWIDRLLFLYTDYVICVSDQVADFYRREFRLPSRKLRIIPNAISLSPFSREPYSLVFRESLDDDTSHFLYACIARLHPQKGHEVLLQAVRLLLNQGYTSFSVLLVGEGPLTDRLRELAASMGLDPWVTFLGVRQDIPRILRHVDAFVLPSLYEGLPLSVIEAMAAELPVIATRVGGTSQIVRDGHTGLLVPPNDPSSLANAMRTLLLNSAAAKRMGRNGRFLVHQFYSIESAAQATEDLFSFCVNQVKHTA